MGLGRTAQLTSDIARRLTGAKRRKAYDVDEVVASFAPLGVCRGRVLMSHRIEGFVLDPLHPRLAQHNQFHEALAMTEAFLDRGYAVDVVSNRRREPTPRGDYDLFLGMHGNFEMLSARLDARCVRVALLDTAHWLFNNQASLRRSLEVQRRRGVTPERDIIVGRNRAIEIADYGMVLGNSFVYDTYAFARTPMFELANPAITEWHWQNDKDHDACRRRFLWLGSRGMAHRGLGRVLEAFAGMPDCHLTVCGGVVDEPEFCKAYRRELLECPNIDLRGWIDVTGTEFAALTRNTIAHVFPSCAEAQAGSVVNCMGAGLIPMVSRQVGIDITSNFGVLLNDDSVPGIREAVQTLADRPTEELQAMSREAWVVATSRHSMENHKKTIGAIVDRVLHEHPNTDLSGFIRLPANGTHGSEGWHGRPH